VGRLTVAQTTHQTATTGNTPEQEPAAQRRARGHHRAPKRNPNRLVIGVTVGIVAVLLGTLAITSSAMRSLLRDSFTRLPERYTELFFDKTPSVVSTGSGPVVHTTVTLIMHGSANSADYTVRGTLTTSPATSPPAETTTVSARVGKPTPVTFDLPLPSGATSAEMDVVLVGGTEHIHYRIPNPGQGR
jgi:hypothetical protein